MRKLFFVFIFLGLQFHGSAQCNYSWATWQNQGQTDTASATVMVNGAPIGIKLVTNYPFDFTPTIYNYPAYFSFSDIPPNAIVPRTKWATGVAGQIGRTTVCFSQPVMNPVLLLSSLGSNLISVSLDFSMPFNVLFDGGGNTFASNINIAGQEGYCILEFPGTVSCITISSSTPENYTNLTWGIKNPLTAGFTFTNNCQNNSVSFSSASSSINSPASLINFHWNFGDNDTSTLANPFHVYPTAGLYRVELVVTANNYCTDTISKIVNIYPAYSSNQSVNLCNGNTYNINAHQYSASGLYYDTLSTVAGCDSIVITNLTIDQAISSLNPQTICAGGNYSFNNHIYNTVGNYFDTLRSVSGCDSIVNTQLSVTPFFTSTNLRSVCQGQSYAFNSHVYDSNGIYYDTLHTAAGCDSIIRTSITTIPLPVIAFVHPADLCIESNLLALKYASPTGGFYSGPGISNNIFDPHAASVGTHTLTYAYTDPFTNCANTVHENITVHASPQVKLSVTPVHTHQPNANISFMNLSQGFINSYWDFGDGFTSTDNAGEHAYGDTGHFEVSLMVTDAFGCSNIEALTIFIDGDFSFYAPDAFTPDGDGINDYFSGTGVGIDRFNMAIFNRWGEKVFQTADMKKGWNGKDVPADTYVYKINLMDDYGLSHEYTGRVTVIK
jgi:gliding motility-associated-like protein